MLIRRSLAPMPLCAGALPAQQKAPRSKGGAVFCVSKKHPYPGDAGRFLRLAMVESADSLQEVDRALGAPSAPIQDVGARSSWSSRSGGLGTACVDAGPVDTSSPERARSLPPMEASA
jgi:hypothetical protein